MADYTVIMAVKNCEEFIQEALESIKCQTLEPAQILIIDDNSTDRTMDIVRSFQIDADIYRNPGNGQASALNFALNKVETNFITFLDADDIWLNYKNNEQIYLLNENQNIDVVCGGVANFGNDKNYEVKKREFMKSRQLGSSTFRRDCFDKFGFFDETKAQFSFSWWSNATRKNISFMYSNKISLMRRIHSTNYSNSKASDRRLELLGLIRIHKNANNETI